MNNSSILFMPLKSFIRTITTTSLIFLTGILPVMADDPQGQTPVLDRHFDFLEPKGIHFGQFTIKPSIQTNIEFTDNVLQTNTRAESDIVTIISPEIDIKYQYRDTNLTFQAQGHQYLYHDYNMLDRFDFTTQAGIKTPLSRSTTLSSHIIKKRHFARGLENNGEIISASEPVQYDTHGFINRLAIDQSRLQWELGLDAFDTQYKNTRQLSNNQPIIQNDRDRRTYTALARVTRNTKTSQQNNQNNQNIPPFKQSLGIKYTYLDFARRNYIDGVGYTGVSQNRQRLTVLGGIEKQAIGKWSGHIELGAGYQIPESSALDNQFSYLMDMNITYMATPLTNLIFEFDRLFDDSTSATEGAIETRIGSAIVHEFRRGGILKLGVDYRKRDFQNGRKDDTLATNLGARYLLNKHWAANGAVRFAKRNSNQPNGSFDETVISLGLKRSF